MTSYIALDRTNLLDLRSALTMTWPVFPVIPRIMTNSFGVSLVGDIIAYA